MNDVWRVASEGGTPMQVAGDRYANEYWAPPSPTDRGTLAITARGNVSGTVVASRPQPHRRERDLARALTSPARGHGGTPRYEAVTNGGAKDTWPMWSADGAPLYFVRDRAGAQNIWTRRRRRGGAAAAQR